MENAKSIRIEPQTQIWGSILTQPLCRFSKNLLHLHYFLLCILEGRGVPKRHLVYLALRDLFLVSEHFYDITDKYSS